MTSRKCSDKTRAAARPAMLPPITIARSLPVCATPALTVFVMRVCLLLLSLQSVRKFATNFLHTHETKHAPRWLIPEMWEKKFLRLSKDWEYFPPGCVVKPHSSAAERSTALE